MVGLLWGANIGILVYPIIDVCFKKESFVDWIDKKIESNQNTINVEQERAAELENQLEKATDEQTKKGIKNSLYIQNYQISWYQYFDRLYNSIRPHIYNYAPRNPFSTVVLIIVFALIGTLVKVAFIIAHSIISASIAQRTIRQIRNIMFQKVIHYEVNYFTQEGVSNTMSRLLSDTGNLSSGIVNLYGKLVREPVKMIVCLVGAALISWQLLLLTLLLVPIAAYSIRWLAKSIKRVARRSMEQGVLLFGRLEESIRAIRVVKSFSRERYEYGKFRKTNQKLYEIGMKVARYDALTNPMTEVLGILMICIGVLAGAYLVMDERTHIFGIRMCSVPLSQTMLLLFFGFLAGAADPARKLSDIFTQFQTAVAASDRVYEMIDRPIPIKDPEKPVKLSRHKKSLCFDNISFHYGQGRPILKNVSLEIPFGETIGIVGPSGCGKSTLLSLIPRFADPDSGSIKIDGIEIRTTRLRTLRGMMGIVTQEPILFNDTVFNNILYSMPNASEKEVIEAAQNAYAHEFITNELEKGYDTIVGPGGGQLSGGQRQRIALARAILSDPAIFLLDEATSQIDLYSEQMIHKALSNFVGKRTTVLVTHRLSALALTDRVVIMQDGEIECVGTHEELLRKSPYYAKLQQID
ncbi:MAG: ABC transporter ATP-binding protein [Thermoguttaceae bacterium]